MPRMQDILDKAEREGAVRRVRTEVQTAVADGPLPAPDLHAGHPLASSMTSRSPVGAAAAQVAPLTPSRVVAGAHLDPRLITASSADTRVAEQYRALRTRILHADPAAPVNVVLLTSAGRGEGKTLTAGNLGLAMAQEWQRRVCIVDADFRHPQMQRLFGLPDGPGLCDVLAGHVPLEEALVTLEEHEVTILPAGHVPAHSAELLGTSAMRRTLDTLRSRFDRIVIDTAPAAPLADVSILAPLVDRVLIVVRAGNTTKPAIHDAISAVDPAKLLGFVLNDTE